MSHKFVLILFGIGVILIIIDLSRRSVACPINNNNSVLENNPYNQDIKNKFGIMWKDTSPWSGTFVTNPIKRTLNDKE